MFSLKGILSYVHNVCCSATGGADSDAHGSEASGSPVEDKEGAQPFGAGKFGMLFICVITVYCKRVLT